MAEDYHVSLVSVEHAYDLLSEEGYIDPVERKGYMVIYREKDFFAGPVKKTARRKAHCWRIMNTSPTVLWQRRCAKS
jgi:GntR family transcriptional regulator/MocR family aminotransferase